MDAFLVWALLHMPEDEARRFVGWYGWFTLAVCLAWILFCGGLLWKLMA